MRFKEYIDDNDVVQLIELYMFIEHGENLNEAINFHELLRKIELKAHKGKGLLSILKDAGKEVSNLIKLLFKLYINKDDEETKQEIVKSIKKVKKEQILDVLLKLDLLTLHAITGPIHILDALTGWHIGPDIEVKGDNITTRVGKALSHLSNVHDTLVPGQGMRKKVTDIIQNIKSLFGK